MPKRRSRLNIFEILIEIIILIIFVRLMFSINYLTGIFYLFAIGIAAWKKILFRKKYISWMIIFGTFLSYFAGLLVPHIINNYLQQNIIGALIISVIAFLIWRKARRLRHGKK